MKNNIIPLTIILSSLALVGCNISKNNPSSKRVDLYTDEATYTKNDIAISFTNLNEYSFDNTQVSFYLEMVSSKIEKTKYKIASPQVVRESNGAKYDVSGLWFDPTTIELECDIKKTTSFSFTIPTPLSEEKYYFEFKGNDEQIRYHLYEKPDELREKITVHCNFGNGDNGTLVVPKGRKLSSYNWISSDYIYGCYQWYFDSAKSNSIQDSYVVNEEITIYGNKVTILKYNTPSGITSAYVSGYNFIPSSGQIIIPKEYNNLSIYSILAGSFPNQVVGMKEIYIPKTVKISSYMNFNSCRDLTTVYFEGTETEWASVNEATFKNTVTIIFNSYI